MRYDFREVPTLKEQPPIRVVDTPYTAITASVALDYANVLRGDENTSPLASERNRLSRKLQQYVLKERQEVQLSPEESEVVLGSLRQLALDSPQSLSVGGEHLAGFSSYVDSARDIMISRLLQRQFGE